MVSEIPGLFSSPYYIDIDYSIPSSLAPPRSMGSHGLDGKTPAPHRSRLAGAIKENKSANTLNMHLEKQGR